MQKNPVCYWELASHNAQATAEFLKQVFDWEVHFDADTKIYEIPAGEEANCFAGGGVFTLRKAKLPFLTIYIRVQDIQAKARLVEEAGGYILEGPFELPSGGWICLFNEPSGVTLAMHQPSARQ